LAEETGETLTEAVVVALRERLERERRHRRPDVVARIRRLADELAEIPTLDDRTADEIIGYDEHGLPT
jgi:antitoxin VapB